MGLLQIVRGQLLQTVTRYGDVKVYQILQNDEKTHLLALKYTTVTFYVYQLFYAIFR